MMTKGHAPSSLPQPIDPSLRATARERYVNGEEIDDIAADMRLVSRTVRSWASRDGWKADRIGNAVQQAVRLLPRGHKNELRHLSDADQMAAAKLLHHHLEVLRQSPASSVADLRNTPERQGVVAVLSQIVGTLKTVHGWKDASDSGPLHDSVRFSDPEPIDVQEVKQLQDKPLE